ncbi:hypothetical protein C0585_00395 [Candidatus Woesearchaeota archaeon]|nr:MAG: hypothetical protein C0585_00395 [Candidatus Woesearchaeota archaeon]
MKRFYCILLLIIISFCGYSNDTIFFRISEKGEIIECEESNMYFTIFEEDANMFSISSKYKIFPYNNEYLKFIASKVPVGIISVYCGDQLIARGKNNDNMLNGIWELWYYNNKHPDEVTFINNYMHGPLKSYYDNGQLLRIESYKEGKIIEGQCFTKNGADTAYFEYVRKAMFGSKDIDFNNYFLENLHLPQHIIDNRISGYAIFDIAIDENGRIENVEFVGGDEVFKSTIDEIIYNSSDNWKPLFYNGIPSPVIIRMPFTINLDASSDEINYQQIHNDGAFYLSKKKYKEAIESFTYIIEKYPKESYAYFNRGQAYFFNGDKIEACEDWEMAVLLGYIDAIEYKDKYCNIQAKLGYLYNAAKKFEENNSFHEAIDYYLKILELMPESASSIYGKLARAYIKSGNIEKGCYYVEEAQKLGDTNSKLLKDKYCNE